MEPLLTRWRLGSVGPCGGARWRGLRVRACSRGAQRARRRDTERAGGRASPAEGPQRLSKVLAAAGVAARRKAEEIIFSSQVTVNGVVVTTPQTRVDASKDVIEVDGRRVDTANQEKYYFAVNKPKGFLCSAKPSYKEGENKKLVLDLFENWISGWKKSNPQGKVPPRLFTVGRLDANSYGLLLVTNDGQWAQKVAHPSANITKEYFVRVNSKPTNQQVKTVVEGCMVEGRHVSPVAVQLEGDRSMRVAVSDGRKREVRVLVEHCGLEVEALKRVRIGQYRLPADLKIGQIRELSRNDLQKIVRLPTPSIPRGTSTARGMPRKSR